MDSSEVSPCKFCKRDKFPDCIKNCKKLDKYQSQFIDKVELFKFNDDLNEHSIFISTTPWKRRQRSY
jgi:hypothetical protein